VDVTLMYISAPSQVKSEKRFLLILFLIVLAARFSWLDRVDELDLELARVPLDITHLLASSASYCLQGIESLDRGRDEDLFRFEVDSL
jgi:hypothetical protein